MSQNLGIAMIGEYSVSDSTAKRALGTVCIEPVYPTTLATDVNQINFRVNRYMKYTNDAFTEVVGMVTGIDDIDFTSCGSDFSACNGGVAFTQFAGVARSVTAANEFSWFCGYGPLDAVAAVDSSAIAVGESICLESNSDGECDNALEIVATSSATKGEVIQYNAGYMGWCSVAQSGDFCGAYLTRYPI